MRKKNKLDINKLAKFENQYVAFTFDKSKVLASGPTIKEVEKKLKTNNISDIVISYVPPLSKYIAPICP